MASKSSLVSLKGLAPRNSLSSDDESDSRHENEEEEQLLIQPENAQSSPKRIQPMMEAAEGKHRASRWPRWWPIALRPSRWLSWLVLFSIVVLLLVVIPLHFLVYRRPKAGYEMSPPWYPSPPGGIAAEWSTSYAMAAALVNQMSLIEKVNITTGTGWMMGMCVGNTGTVDRLGFPSLCLQDGPLGIRFADNITAFPAGITVGATWNRQLMRERGKALGNEARLKGINVLLGPAMGPLGRSPLGGRNWEGFGSDPVLQGIAAAETIEGIQSEGVIATAKHWVGNEQEHFRQSGEWGTSNAISSNIDDRALHEIYGWPFQDSIRAGVGSVMCAYQQVNNSYACQNSKLMNGVLKDEYGFQGFIQSDWLAQRSGVASALAGLDMSMPGDGLGWQDGLSLWGGALTTAILNGSVPLSRLDDMATRIVAAWYQMGQNQLDKFKNGPNFSSWTKEKYGLLHPGSDDESTGLVNQFVNVQGEGITFHSLTARNVAIEGTVLVKNNNSFLPMNNFGYSKMLGFVHESTEKRKIGIFGSSAFPDPAGPNSCPDRACMNWAIGSGWGSGAVEFPYLVAPYTALTRFFNNESAVELTSYKSNRLSSTDKEALKKLDVCFVFLVSNGGEGYLSADNVKADRNDLLPQKGGDELVEEVADDCGGGKGDVVVVIHSVGPVVVEQFIDKPAVKAVLFANLPGQESGNALVDILGGTENPSGRLPYTVGKSLSDYGEAADIIRTALPLVVPQAYFKEGSLIDYRHFDQNMIQPRFEFGYGLSYTTFSMSDLKVDVLKPRVPFLDPRPAHATKPPSFNTTLPGISNSLFPPDFRRLKKYVYPYLSSDDDIIYDPLEPQAPNALSPAGGAQGGNPALFERHVNITVSVRNTGSVAGATVVQLYVVMPRNYKDVENKDRIHFPPRMLRNFDKVMLQPGEEKIITMGLTRRDLSYWSIRDQNWKMPTKRRINFEVGFSSRNLPLQGGF